MFEFQIQRILNKLILSIYSLNQFKIIYKSQIRYVDYEKTSAVPFKFI